MVRGSSVGVEAGAGFVCWGEAWIFPGCWGLFGAVCCVVVVVAGIVEDRKLGGGGGGGGGKPKGRVMVMGWDGEGNFSHVFYT